MSMIYAAAAVCSGDEPATYIVLLLISIAAAVWFFRSTEREMEERRHEDF